MAFKLGKGNREYNMPKSIGGGGGTNVLKKRLDNGVVAEANNDGSIFIDPRASMDSNSLKRTIKHEAKHLHDMETGKSAYGDEWVMWEDKIYIRRTINGEKVIDGPAGRLPEGHPEHPWEQSAIKAETDPNVTMELKGISTEEVDVNQEGESGETPMKWKFGKKLWKGAKNLGASIVKNNPVSMAVRAAKGEDMVRGEGFMGLKGEGGDEGEGMEPDARSKAREAMEMMRGGGGGIFSALGGPAGIIAGKAYEKLKKHKQDKRREMEEATGED